MNAMRVNSLSSRCLHAEHVHPRWRQLPHLTLAADRLFLAIKDVYFCKAGPRRAFAEGGVAADACRLSADSTIAGQCAALDGFQLDFRARIEADKVPTDSSSSCIIHRCV